MKAMTVVVMIVYLALIYMTVHTFTYVAYESPLSSTIETFNRSGVPAPSGLLGFDTFLSVAANFFSSVWNFLTFNIGTPVLADGSVLPFWLTWLPALMVAPVWIVVMLFLIPLLIKVAHVLVDALDAIIPF